MTYRREEEIKYLIENLDYAFLQDDINKKGDIDLVLNPNDLIKLQKRIKSNYYILFIYSNDFGSIKVDLISRNYDVLSNILSLDIIIKSNINKYDVNIEETLKSIKYIKGFYYYSDDIKNNYKTVKNKLKFSNIYNTKYFIKKSIPLKYLIKRIIERIIIPTGNILILNELDNILEKAYIENARKYIKTKSIIKSFLYILNKPNVAIYYGPIKYIFNYNKIKYLRFKKDNLRLKIVLWTVK